MNQTYTKLRGKSKSGRPIVEKHNYSMDSGKTFNWKFFLYFSLFVVLFTIIYLLIYYDLIVFFDREAIIEKTVIAIDFNQAESEFSHYFWNIANGLLLGFYLSVVFPISGKRNKYITALLILAIILFAILSFGLIGLYLYINLPILVQKTYISNTSQGILFFSENLAFFLVIYAISFLIESEVD